jgi:formylglycine-generating enzyme required for sulfatase activity
MTLAVLTSCKKTTDPLDQVSNPVFNPASGTYASAINVFISCPTNGATIRYTTDASEPTSTSTLYSSAINVSATTIIKAKAFRSGWTTSATSTANYTITESVATPGFNVPGDIYDAPQSISLSSATVGATIRYTTNGSEPTAESVLYSSPIAVNVTTTIKAKAYKEGLTDSATASTTYTISSNVGHMILVPGGTFTMGRTTGSGDADELPTHSVTLNSFYIGEFEVTQGQYQSIMDNNPASLYGVGKNHPVYNVSWYEMIKYCNLRSMSEGMNPVYTINSSTDPAIWGEVPTTANTTWNSAICNLNANGYRLPTEAEWEYAARGATNATDYLYSGSNDISTIAWYDVNNTPNGTKPVGLKNPNSLGIFDMSGNVWEWCWDWYSGNYYSNSPASNPAGSGTGSYRVMRGGAWGNSAISCRVAEREVFYYPYNSHDSNIYIGFRVCRTNL